MKHIQTDSRMKSFNINNYATVTLTELGAKVYNTHYDDIIMPEDVAELYKALQEAHEQAVKDYERTL